MPPLSLFFWLDFMGVFVGALSGALEAARSKRFDYDFVGVLGLALASALGGGMTRDVLLGRGAPLALNDERYLGVALLGALGGLLFHARLGARIQLFLQFIDAAALGLFAVAGSTRALNAGLASLPALLLGVVTATGGGAWSDVLSGCTPKIFRRGQLYAIAAFVAAAVFVAGDRAGLDRPTASGLGMALGFVLRLLALRFDWHTTPVRELAPAEVSGTAAGRRPRNP